jgi:hypothetical protein
MTSTTLRLKPPAFASASVVATAIALLLLSAYCYAVSASTLAVERFFGKGGKGGGAKPKPSPSKPSGKKAPAKKSPSKPSGKKAPAKKSPVKAPAKKSPVKAAAKGAPAKAGAKGTPAKGGVPGSRRVPAGGSVPLPDPRRIDRASARPTFAGATPARARALVSAAKTAALASKKATAAAKRPKATAATKQLAKKAAAAAASAQNKVDKIRRTPRGVSGRGVSGTALAGASARGVSGTTPAARANAANAASNAAIAAFRAAALVSNKATAAAKSPNATAATKLFAQKAAATAASTRKKAINAQPTWYGNKKGFYIDDKWVPVSGAEARVLVKRDGKLVPVAVSGTTLAGAGVAGTRANAVVTAAATAALVANKATAAAKGKNATAATRLLARRAAAVSATAKKKAVKLYGASGATSAVAAAGKTTAVQNAGNGDWRALTQDGAAVTKDGSLEWKLSKSGGKDQTVFRDVASRKFEVGKPIAFKMMWKTNGNNGGQSGACTSIKDNNLRCLAGTGDIRLGLFDKGDSSKNAKGMQVRVSPHLSPNWKTSVGGQTVDGRPKPESHTNLSLWTRNNSGGNNRGDGLMDDDCQSGGGHCGYSRDIKTTSGANAPFNAEYPMDVTVTRTSATAYNMDLNMNNSTYKLQGNFANKALVPENIDVMALTYTNTSRPYESISVRDTA